MYVTFGILLYYRLLSSLQALCPRRTWASEQKMFPWPPSSLASEDSSIHAGISSIVYRYSSVLGSQSLFLYGTVYLPALYQHSLYRNVIRIYCTIQFLELCAVQITELLDGVL